jgi:hypothetical protein
MEDLLTDTGKYKMSYEVVSRLGGERLQLCETRTIAVTIVKDSGDIIREAWFTKKGKYCGRGNPNLM